eukprot:5611162-Pyramimonas_sp.AAC.1
MRETWSRRKVARSTTPTQTKTVGTLSTTTWQATTLGSHGETGLREAGGDYGVVQSYGQGPGYELQVP